MSSMIGCHRWAGRIPPALAHPPPDSVTMSPGRKRIEGYSVMRDRTGNESIRYVHSVSVPLSRHVGDGCATLTEPVVVWHALDTTPHRRHVQALGRWLGIVVVPRPLILDLAGESEC